MPTLWYMSLGSVESKQTANTSDTIELIQKTALQLPNESHNQLTSGCTTFLIWLNCMRTSALFAFSSYTHQTTIFQSIAGSCQHRRRPIAGNMSSDKFRMLYTYSQPLRGSEQHLRLSIRNTKTSTYFGILSIQCLFSLLLHSNGDFPSIIALINFA